MLELIFFYMKGKIKLDIRYIIENYRRFTERSTVKELKETLVEMEGYIGNYYRDKYDEKHLYHITGIDDKLEFIVEELKLGEFECEYIKGKHVNVYEIMKSDEIGSEMFEKMKVNIFTLSETIRDNFKQKDESYSSLLESVKKMYDKLSDLEYKLSDMYIPEYYTLDLENESIDDTKLIDLFCDRIGIIKKDIDLVNADINNAMKVFRDNVICDVNEYDDYGYHFITENYHHFYPTYSDMNFDTISIFRRLKDDEVTILSISYVFKDYRYNGGKRFDEMYVSKESVDDFNSYLCKDLNETLVLM